MNFRKGEIILHVGANCGHEVFKYEEQGLYGFHVEAIPDVFRQLQLRCDQTDRQKAICACLSEKEGREVAFNVASNNAESSSLLPLGRHQLAYPHIDYSEQVTLVTTTLDSLAARGIFVPPDHVVIDVQGAELFVLKGSPISLSSDRLKTITIETSAEPLYEGGAKFAEVFNYLQCFGFYLKDANFNSNGWCDAYFCKPWWPRSGFALEANPGNNVALSSVCTQSSFSAWSKDFNEASRIVVGPPNGSYSFHTDFERNPWVRLDLGREEELSEIVVYNRVVDGPEIAARAFSLGISISCDGASWNLIHDQATEFGGIYGNPLRVYCDSAKARFVKFQILEAAPQALHLDHIEIYATQA